MINKKIYPDVFYGMQMLTEDELLSIKEVINAKSLFRYYGPDLLFKTREFENKLCKYFNSKYALCVSSGTAALKCALVGIGVQPGDEVIIPAYGFIATANAVIACGGIPKFCDVDNSLNMDGEFLKKIISEKTKAVICVHIMGQSCYMESIIDSCRKFNTVLIEDVAQSFGGMYKGITLGMYGSVGCFSFQANKILTTGEGGAITTNDKCIYENSLYYHDQGGRRLHQGYPSWNLPNAVFGENYRMSEISGAIGIVQLKKIRNILKDLKSLKIKLLENLNNLNLDYRTNYDIDGDCSIAICFFIKDLRKREYIVDALKDIGAYRHYNNAVYENTLFENIQFKHPIISKNYENVTNDYMQLDKCKNAERMSKQAIWIPISPVYQNTDIEYISTRIREEIHHAHCL